MSFFSELFRPVNTITDADRERGYYFDLDHKKRSVETKELVFSALQGQCYCLVGVKSGHVYKNYTLETIDAVNKKLIAEGRRYVWKEYSHCNGQSLWYPYDPVARKPFKLAYGVNYGSSLTHYRKIVYLNRLGNSGMLIPDPDESPVRVAPEDVWMWDHLMDFMAGNSFKKPD